MISYIDFLPDGAVQIDNTNIGTLPVGSYSYEVYQDKWYVITKFIDHEDLTNAHFTLIEPDQVPPEIKAKLLLLI